MKNKCDSETTEGSNDDYFHLIQVKWVKIVIIFFAYIYVTPNSSKSDTFSHDFILNLFYKHSNRSLFSRYTPIGQITILSAPIQNEKFPTYQSMHVMDYSWLKS